MRPAPTPETTAEASGRPNGRLLHAADECDEADGYRPERPLARNCNAVCMGGPGLVDDPEHLPVGGARYDDLAHALAPVLVHLDGRDVLEEFVKLARPIDLEIDLDFRFARARRTSHRSGPVHVQPGLLSGLLVPFLARRNGLPLAAELRLEVPPRDHCHLRPSKLKSLQGNTSSAPSPIRAPWRAPTPPRAPCSPASAAPAARNNRRRCLRYRRAARDAPAPRRGRRCR